MRAAAVLENRQISPKAFVLSMDRRLDFTPGQNVAVTVDPEVPARYYSIISGSSEPDTEILYEIVPDGVLTPRLAWLRPGDTVYLSEPFGTFRDADRQCWWIAGGTGVAPFVSMARSGPVEGKILVHGSRSLQGLHLREHLADLLGDCYRPICSQAGREGSGVQAGRMIEILARASLPRECRYMLCGSAEMVVAVRDLLIEKGVRFTDIISEIFF